MEASRRVVITGLGIVSGFGFGVEPFWRGVLAGRRAIGPVRRFDVERHRTRLASEVPEVPEPSPEPGRDPRLTSSDRFALAAMHEALESAGLAAPHDTRDSAVLFGSSTGGMWELERFYAALSDPAQRRPPLSWVVGQQYNGPGDAVARAIGAQGPVETLSSACTSSTLALAAAFDVLRMGEAELALAGGSDSLCELTYAGFNALRAVDVEPCRPFRTNRAGLNLGEGAAVFVLETLERAEARAAVPLAELVGVGSTCDAHHMTAPAPDGSGAAAAIRQTLVAADVEPDQVAFVNAHGTGTPLNDAAEGRALATVFGDRITSLPVTSTKASVGHLLGAAGAIEAAATVLGLRDGQVHPTADGEGEIDPLAPVCLVHGQPAPIEGSYAVTANLAFGGSNAALLFRRWSPEG